MPLLGLKRQVTSPIPKFQTASRLKFDDSLAINIGERVCLVGKYSSTLVDRLCIIALLPERHGGFGSPHVIIIDAGNQSDIYQCVNFARQYGLDIKDMLRRIVVSRAFTIYQLVNLITNELPKVIRRFDTNQWNGYLSCVLRERSREQELQTRLSESLYISVLNYDQPSSTLMTYQLVSGSLYS